MAKRRTPGPRAKTPNPRAQGKGTPPVAPRHAHIYAKIFDGHVWELAPVDFLGLTPRRMAEEIKTYAAQQHMDIMLDKRDHYIYVQRLDVKRDTRDMDIRALNHRTPMLLRWLMPTWKSKTPTEEETPPPTPGPETPQETEPEVPRPKKRFAPGKYLPAADCEPYVLTIMNRYFDKSLTVAQVQRLIEPLVEEAGEKRPTHYSFVADCLRNLVRDPETLLFNRFAVRGEIPGMHKPPYLYSPTEPVPAWDPLLNEEIIRQRPSITGVPSEAEVRRQKRGPEGDGPLPPEEPTVDVKLGTEASATPPKRVVIEQPGYRVTTHRPMPMTYADPSPTEAVPTPINGSLVTRMQALAREFSVLATEVSNREGDEKLKQEVADLRRRLGEQVRANEKLKAERDSAVSQLQAVTRAQQTIQQILGTKA